MTAAKAHKEREGNKSGRKRGSWVFHPQRLLGEQQENEFKGGDGMYVVTHYDVIGCQCMTKERSKCFEILFITFRNVK